MRTRTDAPTGTGGRRLTPLTDWLRETGMARSSYYYLSIHSPREVPPTITIGKRRYVVDADAWLAARVAGAAA